MRECYLTYAMSVIVARALPDVRDGLKPSQRRILVAMNDLNLGPRTKYRKCAKIAGDTSGNYHPHGEGVIYPTLVRMAQPFNLRYMLVEGQGNFGSVDGDPPAAMRYTEARLRQSSMELLEDIERDTVEFVANYDETRLEPTVLPGKFPNLLVNGCTGIAVGMATSMPPHNLREVVDAIIKVIDAPETTVDELMELIPGPDFPTGALICGRNAIRQAYTSGRGSIVQRARVHEEDRDRGRKRLVITEIPYQVNKTRLIEKIASLHNDGQVRGISDIRDESDRDGMRIVIELGRDGDPGVILNHLYKHTSLQETFSIIMIALVDGRPRTLSLKDLIVEFQRHRMEVIRRRTRYLLDKATARIHILQGLLIALDHIDQVIEIIRGSGTVEEAATRLRAEFGLSEAQAEAILSMRLRRLTGLERKKLEDEQSKLQEQIRYYQDVLAKEELVLEIIKEDLYELREKYGDDRRTEITGEVADLEIEDLITMEEVVVTISNQGYVKRMPPSAYRSQGRGGKGVTGADTKQGDFIEHIFSASTHDFILIFTDRGKVYWLKVYDIPSLSRTARGRAMVNMVQLAKGETMTSFVPVRDFGSGDLVMATAGGKVKRTPLSAFSNPKRTGIIALRLASGDQLIGVEILREGEGVLLATRKGKAIRFESTKSELRPMGRVAAGVKGIRLKGEDRVVSLVLQKEGETVLTACENGYGKRTGWDAYPVKHRGGMGVVNIVASARNGEVVRTMSVGGDDDLMMITGKGQVIRTPIKTISVIGRATQGVRLISLREEDRLVSATRVEAAPKLDAESDENGTSPPESPTEDADPVTE
ncbi:MAG: DNA gyrase subunit A [Planctomycetota bacterium]|nr:DNA gyrase subunit A [Planctomycetota bacterium]